VTATEPDVSRQLLTAYQKGTLVALLFDYDGTLAPIAPHPWLAEMPAETRAILKQLSQRPRLHIGVLSGRALDELIQMVGLADLYYCGTSGLELDLRGKRVLPPESEQFGALMENLARSLHNVAAGASGAWVERKPLGLTVHYRGVEPALIPAFRQRINFILHTLSDKIRAVPGRAAIEVTPNIGWTKGSAVRSILQHIGPNTFPFYAGDSGNDAAGMDVVRSLGGITLGIGMQAPTSASRCLADPAELAALLQNFLRDLERQR
jgi:trehalose 6-phosphate phosphatase